MGLIIVEGNKNSKKLKKIQLFWNGMDSIQLAKQWRESKMQKKIPFSFYRLKSVQDESFIKQLLDSHFLLLNLEIILLATIHFGNKFD